MPSRKMQTCNACAGLRRTRCPTSCPAFAPGHGHAMQCQNQSLIANLRHEDCLVIIPSSPPGRRKEAWVGGDPVGRTPTPTSQPPKRATVAGPSTAARRVAVPDPTSPRAKTILLGPPVYSEQKIIAGTYSTRDACSAGILVVMSASCGGVVAFACANHYDNNGSSSAPVSKYPRDTRGELTRAMTPPNPKPGRLTWAAWPRRRTGRPVARRWAPAQPPAWSSSCCSSVASLAARERRAEGGAPAWWARAAAAAPRRGAAPRSRRAGPPGRDPSR